MTGDAQSNPWAEIVGPCYTVTSMARTLGWTENEVVEAGDQLRLLMLRTDDDVLLFPAYQLHDGKIVEGLQDILLVLQTGTAGRWTWAQWLNVPLPDHDPPRNIQLLIDGRLDEAIREAEHDAWS
ncbi:hypothetical protein DXT68_00210 [Microbacterium foliorum]|uniref:DUF2384 domain-containing protein n=1 Tax=Microbacterium foliorum TaxID=104336 RepID=A0A0F0KRC9_9MICO|nr:hypothetical protein [Microbacterium foliorum]AXL10740.1 hypothetical protein DXT68_00210 [Microbacterium foliorum]KJL21776.1 hypothetical protein RN50_01677 [Microbacterium foliorum]